jgi:hypothetical protein
MDSRDSSYQSIGSLNWTRDDPVIDPAIDYEEHESCCSRLVPWLFRLLSGVIVVLALNHSLEVLNHPCGPNLYGVNMFDALLLWALNAIIAGFVAGNILTLNTYTYLLQKWRER